MNEKLIIIFFLCCTFFVAQSQTQKTLDSLAKINQDCLDGGRATTTCASVYYHQMDSMLNIVYKKLYLRSDSSARNQLKKEQLQWLKKRDNYFKHTVERYTEDIKKDTDNLTMTRHFKLMFEFQDFADFIYDRVKILLSLL